MENKLDGPKEKPMQEISASAPKLPDSGENKVRFMVWFTEALERFNGVKAHHLHAVQAYFTSLGLGASELIETYDEGLKKFGYGKKK